MAAQESRAEARAALKRIFDHLSGWDARVKRRKAAVQRKKEKIA
jgi:hypothetical protein